MASTLFSSFTAEVLPSVPGVPPPLVNTAVRQAATTLCRESGCWIEILAPISSVADTDEYTLASASADGQIRTIMTVFYDNKELGEQTWEGLRRDFPDHPNTDTAGIPYRWAMKDTDTISLFPVVETAVTDAIVVRCTIQPKKAATGVDSKVAEDYEEQIVYGALFKLLIMPDKPWSDPKLGMFYGNMFRNGCMVARARVNKAFSDASLQVEIPKVTPTSISIRRVV